MPVRFRPRAPLGLGRWGFSSALGVISLLGMALPSPAQTIQLKTDVPLNQVVPFQDPVEFQLTAVDGTGQPLGDAQIQVHVLTPPKTPWLTSDFPIVEGTQLLGFRTLAPQGTVTFRQLLPIRGTYQIQVQVSPHTPGQFAPFSQTLTVSIPENPEKYKNTAILALILLVVGLGGGWVIAGPQTLEEGEVAPQPIRLLLSGAIVVALLTLLIVNIFAELADAHGTHPLPPAPPQSLKPKGIDIHLVQAQSAIVGQAIPLTLTLKNPQSGQPLAHHPLHIQVTSLEHGTAVFTYQDTTDRQGNFTWTQQFFDGAPHQLVVEVPAPNSSEPPAPWVKTIEVEGVSPPLSVRLIGLIYLTAIMTLGFGLGFWLRRGLLPSPLKGA